MSKLLQLSIRSMDAAAVDALHCRPLCAGERTPSYSLMPLWWAFTVAL